MIINFILSFLFKFDLKILKLIFNKIFDIIFIYESKVRSIKEILQKQLDKAKPLLEQRGIPESSILGIFLIGDQNYNLGCPGDIINSIIITVPSFEALCINTDSSWSETFHLENGITTAIDIREMRKHFLDQRIAYLEVLYSEYFILNPKYEEIWNTYFINNRDAISILDKQKLAGGVANSILYTINKDATSNQSLYKGYRLYYFLDRYLNDKNFINCMRPESKQHDFLLNLKLGLTKFSNSEKSKLKKSHELIDKTKELFSSYPNLVSPDGEATIKAVDDGLREILKLSLQLESEDNNKKIDKAKKEEFFNRLTNAEMKAYNSIIQEINNEIEGRFSISNLTEKYDISRSVYNNLLMKMREGEVAAVSSHGPKGIYIQVLNSEIQKDIKDRH
jgi:ribosomal protein S25